MYNARPNTTSVVCVICGFSAAKDLANHIIHFHKLTPTVYCEIHNLDPKWYMSEEYATKRTNRMTGSNNIAAGHNGKLSPFSEKFVGYQNVLLDEKHNLIKQLQEKTEATRDKNQSHITRIEYYTKRGYTLEQAKDLLRDHQTTFNLEKCIERYGNEMGLQKWENRQKQWLSTMENKSPEEKAIINQKRMVHSGRISRAEREIFEKLRDNNLLVKKQHKIVAEDKIHYFYYDIVLENRIIEYNGNYWHANPQIYGPHDVIRGGEKAEEIWAYDKIKIQTAINNGYELLILWESDYKKYPKESINKCINFLTTNEQQ
jgi:hypothetical protein